jgi:hypothetical protein
MSNVFRSGKIEVPKQHVGFDRCPRPERSHSWRAPDSTDALLCRKVIPVWVDITARIESDEDAKKKLG